MKNIYIFLSFLITLASGHLFGQTNYFPSSGNVGIGTGAVPIPPYNLDILAPAITDSEDLVRLRVSDAPNDYLTFFNGTGASYSYIPTIKGYYESDNKPAFFLMGEISSVNDNGNYGVVTFDARSGNSFVVNRNLFIWRNYTNNLMALDPNGNLGIGTLTPSNKLEVNGTIRAKEVKLEATNWPDYVFSKDYEMMPLDEVKAFIDQKGHLPGLKSAREYQKEGVGMLELNQKLLEKVEELTLYMLEQQEMSKTQAVINKSLESRLKELEKNSAHRSWVNKLDYSQMMVQLKAGLFEDTP